MKGFKRGGKFIPITDYNKKGTRKSRDQSGKTEGIRMKREPKTMITIAVKIKLLSTISKLDLLRDEEIEELQGTLEYLQQASYERNRAENKARQQLQQELGRPLTLEEFDRLHKEGEKSN